MGNGIKLELPTKLRFLLKPARYKVAWGGRGGVKSWSFARSLLGLGSQIPLRILCTREIQRTIKDSVHRLLSDQIKLLNLDHFYDVTENAIVGLNGTEFLFAGLSDQTAESIKSFEGVDICWPEEAQTITKRSWNILIPTIRKDYRARGLPEEPNHQCQFVGCCSEIWISFNPLLETDETYQRFVVAPPPSAVVVYLTYRDNPWFPKVLEDERVHCQKTQPDDYDNIWEGMPAVVVPGAIFGREMIEMTKGGRLGIVPYDPRLKVHTVWDLGWNDKTAIVICQRGLSEVRVIGYLEDSHKRIDEFAADLNALKLNWGFDFLPHDGFHTARQTGITDAKVLQNFGRSVKPIPHLPDAEQTRIRSLRQLFPRIYMDKDKCARLAECLKRYRRNVPKHGEPSTPLHDEHSHAADAMGYLSLVVEEMSNEDDSMGVSAMQPMRPFDRTMGLLG